jgi:hypothetical protein
MLYKKPVVINSLKRQTKCDAMLMTEFSFLVKIMTYNTDNDAKILMTGISVDITFLLYRHYLLG